MDTAIKKITTIDEYIAGFPAEVRAIMEKMREVIHEAAPGVTEGISYRMPAFRLNDKYVVFFAGFKHHIGLYPLPTAITAFEKELAPYHQGKGSVQFPLDKPVPYELVKKIVRFRVAEKS